MTGSYYAKVIIGMGQERLVAITGKTSVGFRAVDVDPQGNPVGSSTYLPGNATVVPLEKTPHGLVESNPNADDKIDWKAHEDSADDFSADEDNSGGTTTKVSSVSPTNPAAAAFPELFRE